MNLNSQANTLDNASQHHEGAGGDQSLVDVNDRYGDSIIKGNEHLYDAIEVHGVRDGLAGTGASETAFEIDERNPQLYSVYARAKSGDVAAEADSGNAGPTGVDAVGDFSTYDLALAYARELSESYGWPMHDHVINKHPSEVTLQ